MPKLLLDEMLRKLAKWLRVFGVSTEHISGWNDSQILAYAKKHRITLITRDAKLFVRCRKKKIKCILLKSERIPIQLAQLKQALKLRFQFPEKTRCSECNTLLRLAKPSEVRALVHPNVLKHHRKFWICTSCRKAYWMGSHWKNIRRIFKETHTLIR